MSKRMEIAKDFASKINSDYISQIILFGSVARGEDDDDSDIDILIVSNHRDDISESISEEIAWTLHAKGELISAHIMSEKLFNQSKDFSFLSNVLNEGILIG